MKKIRKKNYNTRVKTPIGHNKSKLNNLNKNIISFPTVNNNKEENEKQKEEEKKIENNIEEQQNKSETEKPKENVENIISSNDNKIIEQQKNAKC